MATPSVLTVPSMYGDGILYSGPSAYGSELASQPVDLQVDFQAAPSGGVIVDANTFTTSGGSLEGIRSNDPAFTLPAGTAFEIEIRGTTTSNGITLGDLSAAGNEYGSGFGVHRFISAGNRLWIRQKSAGTTTITHLSIRPLTQGSDFEFTRSTTGTRINEDGYIEDVPYNLASYSESFNNWSKLGVPTIEDNNIIAPNGTLTGAKVTRGSNSTPLRLYNVTFLNQEYTFSVYAKKGNHNQIKIDIGDETGATYTLTDNWQRFTVTSTPTTNKHIDITLPSSTSGDFIYVWGAQLVKGDQPKNYLPTTDRLNLPRLNYPVYGGCPSLLVEPQRTNSVTYSNDLTQWANSFSTDESNVAISPEGIQNAGKLIDTTSTGDHYISTPNVSIAYDTITANSVFVKKGTFNHAQVRLLNGTGTFSYVIATFNLDTGELLGTLGSSGTTNASYKIEKYPNDWWRIILIGSFTNSNVTARRYSVFMYNGTSNQYTGTGNDFIYIYGAQIEAGSYPTSLIHTSGSAVTRNEDKAENAGLGTTDTFNDSEGVLYAEIAALANDGTFREITLNDGTINNVIEFRYNNVDNQIQFVVRDSGSVTVNSQIAFPDVLEYNKIALQYKANDFKVFANGRLAATDTAGTVPSGLNKLDFSWAGNNYFYGNAKAVAVYKTALTDTELANLTSYNNHDLFIPYRSRMQMIGADQELQCTEHDITRFL